MKSRHRVSESVLESLCERLAESIKTGLKAWPLPFPPLSDPDFPVMHPQDQEKIVEMGVGLLQADRGMFDRHLAIVCLLYTSPSPRDMRRSRMPSSA